MLGLGEATSTMLRLLRPRARCRAPALDESVESCEIVRQPALHYDGNPVSRSRDVAVPPAVQNRILRCGSGAEPVRAGAAVRRASRF